jgi:hypothetical protein
LTPALFTAAQVFYVPSVTLGGGGDQALAPGVVHTNVQDFFALVVSAGAVGLAAPLLVNAQQFYAPSVAIGPAGLVVPLLVNDPVFYTATVTPGAITLAAIALPSTSAVFAPSVSASNDVAVPLLSNTSTLWLPSVGVGAITLGAPLLLNAQQLFVPVLDNGVYTLTSAQAQALYQVYLLHGLQVGVPLSFSQTQRLAGGLVQAISQSGDGTVTISTSAAPVGSGVDVGIMVDELAQWYGLTSPVTLTESSQMGGLVNLSMATSAGVTTVVRQ